MRSWQQWMLVAFVSVALVGCGPMSEARRFYDAAFPEQPVSIDDIVVLDVMGSNAVETVVLDSGRVLNRYELKPNRRFTCRIDKEATTILGAVLLDENRSRLGELDLKGSKTEDRAPGHYFLEITSKR